MGAKKILIVDNSPIVLEMSKAVLEEAGYNVVTSDSALGNVPLIVRENPDLILMDVDMPALLGTKVTELLHSRFQKRKLPPIVLYSVADEERLAILTEKSGADGYIRKSSDYSGLVDAVKKYLEP